jgi:hypothetical protein
MCGLFLSVHLFAAEGVPGNTVGAKALVTDGHVIHDVGNLQNNVTNWGLIGSWPSATTPFSHAPSARWDGKDHLFAAGLWVGGTVLGERLVTTGQYAAEFRATEAPGDTIFATARGAPGGNRYPWSDPDDDGDGAEDEDPLDGVDNDGDGAIDEDFAAVSDQSYRCAMADDLAEIGTVYPDHNPLNLTIVQESHQWAGPLTDGFIGYEYTITNEGVVPIEDLHCGVFADFDVGGTPADDLAGSSLPGTLVRVSDGSFVPVNMAWARDAAAVDPASAYLGIVMCGIETNAASGVEGGMLDYHSVNHFVGNEAFGNGGDPTNDSERYELLSTPGRDPDPASIDKGDYRFLVSAPRIPVLAPGETVVFRFALVAGDLVPEGGIFGQAGEAVSTALGQDFDRDGDPANGAEFRVPWLRPEDVPVPAVTGRLMAGPVPGGIDLVFEIPYGGGGNVLIDRRETAGVPGRTWVLDGAAGSVMDDDACGWPRTYDLKARTAGDPDLILDTVEIPGPMFGALRLEAGPNPFNPRLNIEYTIPESGPARLEVLDLMGRVVKVLIDGPRPAGEDRIQWNGRDDTGREVASGVYLVRLSSDRAVTWQRVTLLR